MMWHTHAVMGASTVWLLLPFILTDRPETVAILMALAVIGALSPDLDAKESKIKHLRFGGMKLFMPVATVIHRDFGHRGLLHSFRGWCLWSLMLLPLVVKAGWLPVVALSLGYASHLVGDAATVRGIAFYYPHPRRQHVLPRPLRLITGSAEEELVFVVFSLLVIILLSEHLRLAS